MTNFKKSLSLLVLGFLAGCMPKHYNYDQHTTPQKEAEKRGGKIFKKDLVIYDSSKDLPKAFSIDQQNLWKKALKTLAPYNFSYVNKDEGILQTQWREEGSKRSRFLFTLNPNVEKGFQLIYTQEHKVNGKWKTSRTTEANKVLADVAQKIGG